MSSYQPGNATGNIPNQYGENGKFLEAEGSTMVWGDATGPQGATGSQGATGVQGSGGAQGSVGAQGAAGTQGSVGAQGAVGTQGVAGSQGFQGLQGAAGAQGAVGTQGAAGSQGFQGKQGDKAGLPYNFNTSTSVANPGTGNIAFNSGTIGSVTTISMNASSSDGANQGSFIDTWASSTSTPTGTLIICDDSDASAEYCTFNISAVASEATNTWYELTVANISGNLPSSAESLVVQYSQAGNLGAQGFQGLQGSTGSQGTQGFQGHQGAAGSQGFQGLQGAAGSQGAAGTGSQGAQGAAGSAGSQGAQGSAGAQGTQGATGPGNYYRYSGAPVSVSSTTFTISNGYTMDSTLTIGMSVNGTQTISIGSASYGASLGICQSGALTGTIAYTNGSATVTGTSTAFSTAGANLIVPGDILYDSTNSVVVGVVKTVSSGTSIILQQNFSGTTKTGAAFKRGGANGTTMSGSGATWGVYFNLYMVNGGSGSTWVLSTRNVNAGQTLVDLPSGYSSYYRQYPFAVVLNTSGNIKSFLVNQWDAYTCRCLFNDGGWNNNQVQSSGTATTATQISCIQYVPGIGTMGIFETINVYNTAGAALYMGPTNNVQRIVSWINVATSLQAWACIDLELSSSQSYYYQNDSSGQATSVYVQGWIASNVA